MQPFGLLNFLKLALQPTEENTPPSTTATEEEILDKNTATIPEGNTRPIAAYQDFIDRHERAAKRIKKGAK